MNATLHRRDIRSEEFILLARFCWVLQNVEGWHDRIPYVLGEVVMRLPVWKNTHTGWRLYRYKNFKRQAFGIEVADFRRTCRYLKVSEGEMVKTLYRLSMLSVVMEQKDYQKPKFKMKFRGVKIGWEGIIPPCDFFGFVIERRRAEGHFR
jgi:hypothetical protein